MSTKLNAETPLLVPLEQLVNHYDVDSAYVVKQYPHHRGINTQVRYWVETRKPYGQRLVYQTLDPYTCKWLKEKPGAYVALAIMRVNCDYDHPQCGHVIPLVYPTFLNLNNQQFCELALAYSYTEYQKNVIMKELIERFGPVQPPPWRNDPPINLADANRAENPLPYELRVERLTTPEGIICETFAAAHTRVRKERRALKLQQHPELADEPKRTRAPTKFKKVDPHSVDNLNDHELALFNELMQPPSD
jgi:hypothetical protein